jgi:hypothetical protein
MQTGDSIHHFAPFIARFLGDDMTPQLKHLREPGPITVAREGLARGDIALLNAPMTDISCAGPLLLVACRGESKDQLDISSQLWLILFDDHDIIATLVHNGLGHGPLGQQRIHGDHPLPQDELA